MKKILVPTDFSELAENALKYAAQLAKRTDAELLLLHVYTIPVFTENPILMNDNQYLEEQAIRGLEEAKQSVEELNSGLKVSFDARVGFPIDIIAVHAEEHHADIIIMGTQGTGYVHERMMGSTASALIRKVGIPVMVIDKHVQFREPKNIVLAVDYKETDNRSVLKPLRNLVERFHSHVCVLNVYSDANSIPTYDEIDENFRLDKALKGIEHTFFEVNNPDAMQAINDFVKKQNIDMITIISRKHYLIGRIFREPFTQKMAFHSEVPFLALHE